MRLMIKFALVGALGASLSGCIAAVAAIPVLAGGGMVGSQVADNGDNRPEPTSIPLPPFERTSGAAVPVAEPAGVVQSEPTDVTAAPLAESSLTTSAPGQLSTADTAIAPSPIEPPIEPPVEAINEQPAAQSISVPVVTGVTPAGSLPPVELTMPDGSRISLSGGSATGDESGLAPSTPPIAPPQSTAIAAGGPGAYQSLYDFALSRSGPRNVGEVRNSALLAVPAALEPETSQCALSQPALVIDLDPADQPLDTEQSYAANPELAQVLAGLREREVSIHWISGNSADQAGAIRRLLTETTLDPLGTDELVLMRYPDDRKQTRRRAVGATHCLIAIAGEERRDFDELYAFLKNPDSAAALEPLIGEGWFLIPPALSPVDQ